MAAKSGGRGRRGRGRVASTETRIPRATRLALVLLRLFAGGFFLVTAWWKLVQEGYSIGEKIEAFRVNEYVPLIEHAIRHPPEVFGARLDLFTAFLRDVMLPGAAFFAPALLLFEALLGLSLVVGLGVRLTASLGFLMMAAFSLAKPQPGAGPEDPVGVFLFTVTSANWPVTLILLALALAAAGRYAGFDAWLRRRAPGWLRWVG